MNVTLARHDVHTKIVFDPYLKLCVLLAMVLSVCCMLSTAQTVSIYSSVVGTVADPTGAAVPGAKVTVTDPATNISVSAITDDQGFYHVDRLTAGTYNVSVTKDGFKGIESHGISLSSGQSLRADYALPVGSVNESVTIKETAPLINLQNQEVSSAIDFETRKYLAVTVPSGTVIPDFNPATTLSGTNQNVFSFAGSLQNEYDYQINGMTFTRNGIPAAYTEWASQETINYVDNGAQYQSQAVVDLTMKSGSNRFHGSAADYYTSGGLSSRNTFSTSQPSFVRHIFTSGISGPIIKDRLFFYAGFASSPTAGNYLIGATVPTTAQASGDFSALLPGTKIIDPRTGVAFSGNIIPSNRISSVSSAFISEFYPAPNTNATNNFQTFIKNPVVTSLNPYGRIDYKVSEKNSLFGNWIVQAARNSNYTTATTLPTVGPPYLTRTDQEGGITDVEAFTPAVLNEFGVGFSRDYLATVGHTLGSAVINNIGLQGVSLPGVPGIPPMAIQGLTTPTQPSLSVSTFDTYSVRDTLSWTKGRHTLKFGFAVAQNRFGSYPGQPDPAFGSFSFTSALKNGTGNALANFLLGLPSSESRQLEFNRQHFRYTTDQGFITDSYEASRNLTVNFGLRYEYHQAPYETGGQSYNVDLSNGHIILSSDAARNLVTPPVLNNPAFTFVTAKNAGYPTHLYSIGQKNFAPRFGFAYRLGDKTVVRGGYGVYFDFTPPQGTASDLFTVLESFVPNTITNGVPLYQFPNPFSANPSAVGTLAASSYEKNLRMPYTQQWSLTLERQLLASTALRISYIGSHTAEQLYGAPANIPAPSTTVFTQSRRPFTQFGQMTAYFSGADANYNGLSTQMQYRSSGGIYASASFTWAKNLGIAGQNAAVPIIMNPLNLQADYGNVINPSLVSTGLLSAPIPVGRGRQYFGSSSRWVDAAIGGWNATAAVILRSGDYLTPSYSGYDSTGTGILSARPDAIGNPNNGPRTIQRWFNTGAFSYPGANPSTPLTPPSGPIGRFGNAGVGIIEGPGYEQVDLGVAKGVAIHEQFGLHFFALATNAFNHPSFGDPNLVISAPSTAGTIVASKKDQDAVNVVTGGNRQFTLGVRLEF